MTPSREICGCSHHPAPLGHSRCRLQCEGQTASRIEPGRGGLFARPPHVRPKRTLLQVAKSDFNNLRPRVAKLSGKIGQNFHDTVIYAHAGCYVGHSLGLLLKRGVGELGSYGLALLVRTKG